MMNINFNMDINLQGWAEAIGYKIVGDQLVGEDLDKKYRLEDFKAAVAMYIEEMLEAGYNSSTIEENFFVNDCSDFKTDFECEYATM